VIWPSAKARNISCNGSSYANKILKIFWEN